MSTPRTRTSTELSLRRLGLRLLIVPLLLLLFAGCASRKFVRAEVGEAETRTAEKVSSIETQVEENQTAIVQTRERVDQHDRRITDVSQTARDALDRAMAAGKLAEGTLVSETVLNNDRVKFDLEKAELTDDSRVALDEFAQPLKTENKGIYIEIQGHTDATGPDDYNLRLGEERAEAVRRYLNNEHGFPLHRMSVISYGEAAPAVDNSTRDGRMQNRRVVLVVLR